MFNVSAFMRLCYSISIATLILTGVVGSHAGTNNFSVPFFRGSPNSELGFWENFTTASGGENSPDRPGSTSGAVLIQSNTNAILTSTFNIYNPADLSEFTLRDGTPFVLGTVVLQARTLGAELDYGAVALTYTNESGSHSLPPAYRLERDRGTTLGASLSLLWQWDLTGLGVTNYSVSFKAIGPSLSFDSVTLDTWDQFAKVVPEIFYNSSLPSLERWMYPFNASPCDRPAGAVFGTFGDASGVDSRHAQHLLGWDTANAFPTNRGPTKYLVRSARVTLTINRGNLFVYDPSHDDYRSYFETNAPGFIADTDTGRPVEMFGIGFRNGFNINTFDQCAPFGGAATAQRNAFTVSWNTNGVLADVSNNIGKTNELYPSFEAWPFAVGRTTGAAAAEPVPAGAKITFDLNLNDPFVFAYVQRALNDGKLRLGLSSFHGGEQGQPAFPDFVTHFSETATEPTKIELVAVAVRDTDSDADGLPDDWEEFYFGQLAATGGQDSDGDGQSNALEMAAGTNPRATTSALRVTSVSSTNGAVNLRWAHAPNRQYQLETCDDFSVWTPVAGFAPVYPEPGVAEWSNRSPDRAKKFYRLRAQ
jgi:hypothetical protein